MSDHERMQFLYRVVSRDLHDELQETRAKLAKMHRRCQDAERSLLAAKMDGQTSGRAESASRIADLERMLDDQRRELTRLRAKSMLDDCNISGMRMRIALLTGKPKDADRE